MPPRLQRESTAARAVVAVITLVEFIPRITSTLFELVQWVGGSLGVLFISILRGGTQVVGMISFIVVGILYVNTRYDPAGAIACAVKPSWCLSNSTEMFRT